MNRPLDDDFLNDTPETAAVAVERKPGKLPVTASQAHRRALRAVAEEVRKSRAYRDARAKFRASERARDAPCVFCGNRIDWSIRDPNDPAVWELDHETPIASADTPARVKALLFDRRNWESSHRVCNTSVGAGERLRAVPPRPEHTPPEVQYNHELGGWPSEAW